MSKLNGMYVLGQRNNTVFVRIPIELQTETGGCSCEYCRAHPKQTPMWDTLAIAIPEEGKSARGHTWTVHMPDPTDAIG